MKRLAIITTCVLLAACDVGPASAHQESPRHRGIVVETGVCGEHNILVKFKYVYYSYEDGVWTRTEKTHPQYAGLTILDEKVFEIGAPIYATLGRTGEAKVYAPRERRFYTGYVIEKLHHVELLKKSMCDEF